MKRFCLLRAYRGLKLFISFLVFIFGYGVYYVPIGD